MTEETILDVYAIWEEIYTVTFYKNQTMEAVVHGTRKVNVSNKVDSLPDPPAAAYGALFVGWNTNKSGGAETAFTINTVVTSNLEVFAMWTFDINVTGDGSESFPFLIYNETDLRRVGTNGSVAGGPVWSLSAHYKQVESFTMTGGNFPPIGNNSTNNNNSRFSGSYKGDENTITNLTINSSEQYTGLFGYTASGAKVENLGLINVNVNSSTEYTGSLAGYAGGTTITNCYATGSISGGRTIGGLVGEGNRVTITNCYTSVSVYGTGGQVGGLAGRILFNSNVKSCYATGSVSGRQGYIGGLIGSTYEVNNITNCYATGNVILRSGDAGTNSVGGLVGLFSGAISGEPRTNITNCYATGSVSFTTASSPAYDFGIGGLVGTGGTGASGGVNYSVALNPRVSVDVNTSIGRVIGRRNGSSGNNYANAGMEVWREDTLINITSTSTQHGTGINAPQWENNTWWQTTGPGFSSTVWEFHNAEKLPTLRNTPGGSAIQNPQVLSAVPVTISFNINSGSGTTPAAQNVFPGTSITLPTGAGFSRTGYTFDGWNTNTSGTGTNYAAGSSYTVSAAITLHAKWIVQVGTGTEADPFLVRNETDLKRVGTGESVGTGPAWSLSAHYRQIASFTMTGGNFTPIGSADDPFTGRYNGGDHTISNLSIDREGISNTGLFGLVVNAELRNLGLINVNIKSHNAHITGSLVANMRNSTMEKCYATGSVTATYGAGTTAQSTGGLVGIINEGSTVKNCYAAVNTEGEIVTGGFAGRLLGSSTIESSYATGDVFGSNNYVGGLVGDVSFTTENNNSMIRNCYATGNVTSRVGLVGSLVGELSGTSAIENCYATGSAGTSSSNNASGLVATMRGSGGNVIKNTVALGPYLTTWGSSGRVTSGFDGIHSNNYGRTEMLVRGRTVTENIGHDQRNGVGIAAAQWQNNSWWQAGGTGSGPGFSSTVWDFHGNTKLPTLKNTPGSSDAQNPRVQAIPTMVTVTFNLNGGTGTPPESQTTALGTNIGLPYGTTISNSRPGFTFGGWNTLADGTGTNYRAVAGSYYTVTGNITLYAKWD
jgi:uncharacterized repeat protein (TIGR02543 family)